MAHRAVFGRAGCNKKSQCNTLGVKRILKFNYLTFHFFKIGEYKVKIFSKATRVKGQLYTTSCVNRANMNNVNV